MGRLTRSQVIRAHCIECSGGSRAEVRNCTVTRCNLWRFRMGREIPPEAETGAKCTVSEKKNCG